MSFFLSFFFSTCHWPPHAFFVQHVTKFSHTLTSHFLPPNLHLSAPTRKHHHHHHIFITLFLLTIMQQDTDSSAKSSAAAIRIRENQRRSRARRKEYVEGMQRKLQDFETKGVAATLEMQQAARDVAIENSRLKMLLAHSGVGVDAVESFLQSFKGQDAAEAEQYAAKIATAESIASLGRASTVATLFPEHAHIDKLAVLASASMQQQNGSGTSASASTSTSGHDSDTTITSDDSTTGPSTGPVTPSSSHMNAPSPSDVDFSSEAPQTMSCDAAAHIIAQMQGCGFREPSSKGGHLEGQNSDYLIQNSAFLKILEAASIFN